MRYGHGYDGQPLAEHFEEPNHPGSAAFSLKKAFLAMAMAAGIAGAVALAFVLVKSKTPSRKTRAGRGGRGSLRNPA